MIPPSQIMVLLIPHSNLITISKFLFKTSIHIISKGVADVQSQLPSCPQQQNPKLVPQLRMLYQTQDVKSVAITMGSRLIA